jgi:amino acid adenylation domain-containing protein
MIAGLIGIMKVGAAYVPLDPAYPKERLALLVADSAVTVVVTARDSATAFPATAELLLIDEPGMLCTEAGNLELDGQPSDAAYVIYTSGSTGTPKGVVVEHRQVLRLFTATDRWFQFGSSGVWTLFHSFGFDFSVWEIWGALLFGGRLVIVPHQVARSPEAFLELLARERVTVLSQTPSAFQALSRADELANKTLPLALETIVFGGEALDPQILRSWIARRGDASHRLINMYGITETTVHVTYRRITRRDLDVTGRSPIGVPIPDLSVYLLDNHGQREVGPGEVGEIYVGGAGVARGYLNRPELDSERFLVDPFAAEPGARMYRSGDLAVRLPNGELEYRGRRDAQLKVRGYRVEPGEIEMALRSCEALSDVAVVARDYGDGDKRLVACVVAVRGRGEPEERFLSALRAVAVQLLPEHCRPSTYVVLSALPLNANGKVDRKALSERAGPALQRGLTLATSSWEEKLRDIFCNALGTAELDADDDFFDKGGTSLTAIKILLAVQEQLGVALDMSVWAEHATFAGFATCVRRAQRATRLDQAAHATEL